MASVTIKVCIDNAAFEEIDGELDRVVATALFAMARAKRAGRDDNISLFDANGNRVGFASFSRKERL